MITFLSHFFIKDYKDYNSPQVRQSYGMLCGAVGIALNIFLFIGKWLAGILSGSIAITAEKFVPPEQPLIVKNAVLLTFVSLTLLI